MSRRIIFVAACLFALEMAIGISDASSTPTPAPTPTSIPVYVYAPSFNGQAHCDSTSSDDRDAIIELLNSRATNPVQIYELPPATPYPSPSPQNFKAAASVPPDPISAVRKAANRGDTAYTVIANLCRSGAQLNATITGYVIQKGQSDPTSDQVSSGTPLTGSLDVLEGANWSPLFVAPSYNGVGYLPILGDNADVINAQVERAMPFQMTVISDVKPVNALCTQTGYSMIIAGQGSLATQLLDPFRLAVTGAQFSISTPNWWQIPERLGLATLTQVALPNKQEIVADVFDCYDGGLWRLVKKISDTAGGEDIRSERAEPTNHIVGHRAQFSFGSDPGVQRHVLDDSISNLELQLNCIVYHRLTDLNTLRQRQLNSPTTIPQTTPGSLAEFPSCFTYYAQFAWVPVLDAPIPPVNRVRIPVPPMATPIPKPTAH